MLMKTYANNKTNYNIELILRFDYVVTYDRI